MARAVNATTSSSSAGRVDFEDLMSARKYDRWRAYGQSKFAILLFARGLARRFEAAGIDASTHAAHPGFVPTDIQRKALRGAAVGTRPTTRLPSGKRFFHKCPAAFLGQSARRAP